MTLKTRWLLFGSLLVLVGFKFLGANFVEAKERSWSDAAGKFSVTAELVSSTDEQVVLRRADGKQITVPRKRLSKADQLFLDKQSVKNKAAVDAFDPDPDPDASRDAITDLAKHFYADLRTKERSHARLALTKKSQKVAQGGKSPLAMLPTPDAGSKSIRPGRVRVDGKMAEISVRVRAGGKLHKTKIHLRQEQDVWRVFAMSAEYPDGERSINFEAAPRSGKKKNPFDQLLGKSFPLDGYQLDGRRLNMSQYKGKVVLVDFWATWCGPCRAEIPNLLANWKKHHDDGFEVIAISIDRDIPALEKFITAEPPPWAVVADNSPKSSKSRKTMAYKYGVRSIPRFILLDRNGKVASVNCRGKRLGKQLTKLLSADSKNLSNVAFEAGY